MAHMVLAEGDLPPSWGSRGAPGGSSGPLEAGLCDRQQRLAQRLRSVAPLPLHLAIQLLIKHHDIWVAPSFCS